MSEVNILKNSTFHISWLGEPSWDHGIKDKVIGF